jgi:WD40 repeat protein
MVTAEGWTHLPGERAVILEKPNESSPYFARVYSVDDFDSPIAEFEHSSPVRFVCLSNAGELIVTVSSLGEVKLWQVAGKKMLRTFGHSRQRATYAELSPNGEFLYVEFRDNTSTTPYASLFKVSNGERQFDLPRVGARRGDTLLPSGPIARAFTPDSQWILPDIDDEHVQRLPTDPVRYAKMIEPRSLTEQDLQDVGFQMRGSD